MTLLELREKRSNLIHEARSLVDKAEKEKRELTTDENVEFDKRMNDSFELKKDIDRREVLEVEERALAARASEPNKPDPEDRGGAAPEVRDWSKLAPEKYRAAFEAEERRSNPLSAREYDAAFNGWCRGGKGAATDAELRALSAGVNAEGGFTLAPMEFLAQLLKGVDDAVYLRQWATGFPVANANGLGVPTLAADPADADWTTELATGSEDATMAFGQRQLKPNPLGKQIKVSNQLLRQSALPAEQIVRDRLVYKFGVAWEKAALVGTGTGQPLGVFVASSSGISAARDITEGNTATTISFDNVVAMKYGLKQQYWANARFLWHRDVAKKIALLKNGNQDFIWRESTRAGEPDRLLGLPVFLSEYVPNTMTTGLYVGILGDFSNYWYVDSLEMTIQRLVELYAATAQTGFIGRLESDGQPVLEEAFVRSKLL